MSLDILLVRHAAHDLGDRVLVGRMPGVGLSLSGRRQAERLARNLARRAVMRVQSSPRRRARETAACIAAAAGLPVEIVPACDEIDMGDWTGRTFADLGEDRRWHRWNSARGSARVPNGESMAEVTARMLRHIADLAASAHDLDRVVVVSHAEPIRALVLHYRGIPAAEFLRVPLDLASVTTLRVDGARGEVLHDNERFEVEEAA